jgi:hypothetical protein
LAATPGDPKCSDLVTIEPAEALERLKTWLPSEAEDMDIPKLIHCIDAVECFTFRYIHQSSDLQPQNLQRSSPEDPSRVPLIRRLHTLCCAANVLPDTYVLNADDVELLPNRSSVASSGTSDVCQGLRGGQRVAVKMLRLPVKPTEVTSKVRGNVPSTVHH